MYLIIKELSSGRISKRRCKPSNFTKERIRRALERLYPAGLVLAPFYIIPRDRWDDALHFHVYLSRDKDGNSQQLDTLQEWAVLPNQRREQIKRLREKIAEDQATLRKLIKECEHVIPEQTKPDRWGTYGSAQCLVCECYLGHYCPKNPKRYCEYDTKNDPAHDFCIHCGAPEERK